MRSRNDRGPRFYEILNMTRPVPFKICIPSRGPARIGIAAFSYRHLCDVVRRKYKVSGDFCIQQEDGTIVCDEEYFKLLAPMTPLTVVEAYASPHRPPANSGHSLGNKRQAQIDPESESMSTPPQKRPHLNIILPPYQSTVVRHSIPHPYYAHPQNTWATNTPMRPVIAPSHMAYHTPHVPSQIQYRLSPSSASTFCPVVQNRSPLAGIVPLARNSVGHVVSPPTCQHQNLSTNFNASNNSSPTSLVSQLQITDVMGNVNMSPSPTRPVASTTAISGSMYHAPVRYTQAPHHHIPPYSQQPLQHTAHSYTGVPPIQSYCVQQLSPIRPTNHLPTSLHQQWQQRQQQMQNSQITPEQLYLNMLPPLTLTNNIRQECENDLALLQMTVENLHQQKTVETLQPPAEQPPHQGTPYVNQPPLVQSSLGSTDSTTITNPGHTLSPSCTIEPLVTSELVTSEPLTIKVVENTAADNTKMANVTDPMGTVSGDRTVDEILSDGCLVGSVVNFDSESTCSVASSESTCSVAGSGTTYSVAPQTELGGVEVENNLKLVPSQTTVVTDQDTNEVQQTLKMLQVVTWPSETNPPFPDEDCDEEENKLCIIEQSNSPLTPQPPSHSQDNLTKQRPKPKPPALFHVPYVHSPRPKSLGDVKYPIIIDADSTKKSYGETLDVHSPDEGYSSSSCSSSPFDTVQDFTSQLPFANYDKKTVAINGGVESVEPPEKGSTDKSPDSVEKVHVESVHGDSEDEYVEDFEEDFVMDIDVFSPLSTPNTTPEKQKPQQPLLPEYLPLEMDTQSTADNDSAGVKNGGPRELIVSISRDSLSSISSISSFNSLPSPSPRFRRSIKCTAVPHNQSTSSSNSVSTSSMQSMTASLENRNPHKHKPSEIPSISSTTDLNSKAPLIVSIPIVNSGNGCTVLEDDNAEDSDEPTTTMELLASKLEKTGQRRTPRIIRLESQCSDEEDNLNERNHVASESPVVQVADYCCEINVPSVCSAKDVSSCVEELSNLCNSPPGGIEGGLSIETLDIGDEIELGGLSQESNSSTELTGMELLNLKAVQNCPQSKEKKEKLSLSHSISKVYCENLTTGLNDQLLQPNNYWKVHSLTGLTGDPRNKVQRYSLGNKILFELSYNSGRWHLRTF